MATAILKPREGIVFLQPEQNFRRLPAEGYEVELTPYYAKALMQGDLELVEPAATVEASEELPAHDEAQLGVLETPSHIEG